MSKRSRSAGNGGAAGHEPDPVEAFRSDDRLYYRIGEVSRITGVKPYVLRYWETEFRWMAPQKSRSKQRLYRKKDVETILLIKKLLYEQRYTIAGARRRLRELGAGRGDGGAPEAPLTLSDAREELGRLRAELSAVRGLLQSPGGG